MATGKSYNFITISIINVYKSDSISDILLFDSLKISCICFFASGMSVLRAFLDYK